MSRLPDAQLIRMALNVLEDASAKAHDEPVERSWGIRLALAYLGSRKQCERWPFDTFWQELDTANANDRWSCLNAALNGIYVQLQIKRKIPVA